MRNVEILLVMSGSGVRIPPSAPFIFNDLREFRESFILPLYTHFIHQALIVVLFHTFSTQWSSPLLTVHYTLYTS